MNAGPRGPEDSTNIRTNVGYEEEKEEHGSGKVEGTLQEASDHSLGTRVSRLHRQLHVQGHRGEVHTHPTHYRHVHLP